MIETIEAHDKDWISVLKSDRLVEYAGEERHIDEIHGMVELVEREIDGDRYKIWTKKLPVSQLGEQKVIIAEKVKEDGDNPVKYLVTNQINAQSAHDRHHRTPGPQRPTLLTATDCWRLYIDPEGNIAFIAIFFQGRRERPLVAASFGARLVVTNDRHPTVGL